jgi:hypothetical protein
MVETVLGDKGLISDCGLTSGNVKQYYVNTSKGGTWYKEEQLKKLG